MRTVRSPPAVAARRPSGLGATPNARPSWAAMTRVARCARVAWRTAFCACSVSRRRSASSASASARPGSVARSVEDFVASSRDAAMSRSRPANSTVDDDRDDGGRERRQRRARQQRSGAGASRVRARGSPRSRRGTRARARSAAGSPRVAPLAGPRRAACRGRARPRRGRGGATPRAAAVRLRWIRRPSRSSSIQPRSRGHSRSSASWATSTVPALTVSRRRSVSSAITRRDVLARSVSSSASGTRRRSTAPSAPSPASRMQHAARDGLLRGVEPLERVLGEPRDRAAHAARCARRRRGAGAARRAAARARAAPSRAGAARRARPRRRPPARRRARARRAGRRAAPGARSARRSSSRRIGPDQHVVGGEQARQLRVRRAAPVVVGPDREHHDAPSVARRARIRTSAAMNAARSVARRGRR